MSMNMVILQGTIPRFDNAVQTYNLEDEKRACARVKFAVKKGTKNPETGYYDDEIFDVIFFGKMAQTIANFGTPGKALIIEGSLMAATPKKDSNGNLVTDANGKTVYGSVGIRVNRFHFQEASPRDNGNSNNGNATTAPAAAPQSFDPFAMPATKTPMPGAASDFPF